MSVRDTITTVGSNNTGLSDVKYIAPNYNESGIYGNPDENGNAPNPYVFEIGVTQMQGNSVEGGNWTAILAPGKYNKDFHTVKCPTGSYIIGAQATYDDGGSALNSLTVSCSGGGDGGSNNTGTRGAGWDFRDPTSGARNKSSGVNMYIGGPNSKYEGPLYGIGFFQQDVTLNNLGEKGGPCVGQGYHGGDCTKVYHKLTPNNVNPGQAGAANWTNPIVDQSGIYGYGLFGPGIVDQQYNNKGNPMNGRKFVPKKGEPLVMLCQAGQYLNGVDVSQDDSGGITGLQWTCGK
jgi:hypothetical protein